ncbi:MAG TPA: hypothetical protein VF145_05835 [Chitinophagaceae bacterium]
MAKKQNDNKQQLSQTGNQDATQQGTADSNNQFPGYPHYSPKEDIMDGRSDTERVNLDVEGLPSFHNAGTPHRLNPGVEQRSEERGPVEDNPEQDPDLRIAMGTEADVTAEERMMLEDDMYYPTQDEDRLRQARLDDTDFDGEKLNEESFGAGQAESGADLDMDSVEANPEDDALGQGDEENQYWSLGGGENDNIVEGTP